MMASEALGPILTAAKMVYAHVKLVRSNRAQCETLGGRIRVVISAIEGLDSVPDSANFREGLTLLESCLADSLEFVQKFTKVKRWYKQALKAHGNASKFDELNERLQACLPLLNLGMVSKQIIDHERDIADQKSDARAIQDKTDEIFELNKKMFQELQALKGAAVQKDEILALQLASIKIQLKQLVRPPETKALIDPHYEVPYSDLLFDRVIGGGSIAQVYAGQWESQPVAIKQFEATFEQAHIKGFAREVAIMSHLRSPYIIQFYGACLVSNRACIVMEYMMQGSLYDYLDTHQLSAVQQQKIALNIARGLHYFHKKGMVHCDLKSANILLNQGLEAKLADFGLAKTRTLSIQSLSKMSQSVPWCAPEVLAGEKATPAVDIYSFGMVLWELVSGKHPYSTISSLGVLTRKVLGGARETIPDTVPAVYRTLITACWQADPSQRPTAAVIIETLQAAVSEPEVKARGGESDVTVSPTPSQSEKQASAKAAYERGYQAEKTNAWKKAKASYEEAADLGLSNAMTRLGMFALQGRAMIPDKASAYAHFKKAAEGGHVRAMKNLAVMLDKGDGVPKDRAQALYWYEKAAEKGDAASIARSQVLSSRGISSAGIG